MKNTASVLNYEILESNYDGRRTNVLIETREFTQWFYVSGRMTAEAAGRWLEPLLLRTANELGEYDAVKAAA